MNHRFQRYANIPDGLTEQEKYKWISDNADANEPALKYDEPLTEDALNDFRAKFADEAIELNAQKDEMQEEVKVLKKRVKDIETRMAAKLKIIADKQLTIVEPGFAFKDMEEKQMVWVNSEGIIVAMRELEPHEMQMSIPMQKVRTMHNPKNKNRSAEEALEEG